jgi:hypothetical protein
MARKPLLLDFDQGDGDQLLFGKPFVARSVGEIFVDQDGIERLKMEVLSGNLAGKEIKIESRVQDSLLGQIQSRPLISVVVHSRDTSFANPKETWIPVGMSAPQVLDRGDF